ncbi:MAG: helix-turn-helix transcriptional regulator, partial [Acidobacteria bacterium]|nr:helix-turn-helix transcriptional regulator [Acidobacteriota bacterium]
AGFVPTGAMVADLRERCGCSVAEFADLIQVTPTTVRRWETTPGRLNLHAFPREALRALYRESRAHQGRGC